MALCKTLTTEYGIDVNYHIITFININWNKRECEFQLDSFISKDARETGKSPILSARYFYNSSRADLDDNFEFDVARPLTPQLYGKLKTESEWADATDC